MKKSIKILFESVCSEKNIEVQTKILFAINEVLKEKPNDIVDTIKQCPEYLRHVIAYEHPKQIITDGSILGVSEMLPENKRSNFAYKCLEVSAEIRDANLVFLKTLPQEKYISFLKNNEVIELKYMPIDMLDDEKERPLMFIDAKNLLSNAYSLSCYLTAVNDFSSRFQIIQSHKSLVKKGDDVVCLMGVLDEECALKLYQEMNDTISNAPISEYSYANFIRILPNKHKLEYALKLKLTKFITLRALLEIFDEVSECSDNIYQLIQKNHSVIRDNLDIQELVPFIPAENVQEFIKQNQNVFKIFHRDFMVENVLPRGRDTAAKKIWADEFPYTDDLSFESIAFLALYVDSDEPWISNFLLGHIWRVKNDGEFDTIKEKCWWAKELKCLDRLRDHYRKVSDKKQQSSSTIPTTQIKSLMFKQNLRESEMSVTKNQENNNNQTQGDSDSKNRKLSN